MANLVFNMMESFNDNFVSESRCRIPTESFIDNYVSGKKCHKYKKHSACTLLTQPVRFSFDLHSLDTTVTGGQ